jgi:hypothetical protein
MQKPDLLGRYTFDVVFLVGLALAFGAHLAFGVGREGEVLIFAFTILGFVFSSLGVVMILEYRRAQCTGTSARCDIGRRPWSTGLSRTRVS